MEVVVRDRLPFDVVDASAAAKATAPGPVARPAGPPFPVPMAAKVRHARPRLLPETPLDVEGVGLQTTFHAPDGRPVVETCGDVTFPRPAIAVVPSASTVDGADVAVPVASPRKTRLRVPRHGAIPVVTRDRTHPVVLGTASLADAAPSGVGGLLVGALVDEVPVLGHRRLGTPRPRPLGAVARGHVGGAKGPRPTVGARPRAVGLDTLVGETFPARVTAPAVPLPATPRPPHGLVRPAALAVAGRPIAPLGRPPVLLGAAHALGAATVGHVPVVTRPLVVGPVPLACGVPRRPCLHAAVADVAGHQVGRRTPRPTKTVVGPFLALAATLRLRHVPVVLVATTVEGQVGHATRLTKETTPAPNVGPSTSSEVVGQTGQVVPRAFRQVLDRLLAPDSPTRWP